MFSYTENTVFPVRTRLSVARFYVDVHSYGHALLSNRSVYAAYETESHTAIAYVVENSSIIAEYYIVSMILERINELE